MLSNAKGVQQGDTDLEMPLHYRREGESDQALGWRQRFLRT